MKEIIQFPRTEHNQDLFEKGERDQKIDRLKRVAVVIFEIPRRIANELKK